MNQSEKRLDSIAEDIEFLEQNNDLTDFQRRVICDFECLMIAAEMQNNIALVNIFRYRMVKYLSAEQLKFRPLGGIKP